MPKICIDSLKKDFGNGILVLNDFSFSSTENEFIVIVGPSGCGKSTLLRIIAGLETPSGGTVKIDDIDITYMEPKLRDVSMVFQNYALYPHMTVYDNLAFPLKLKGVNRKVIKEKVSKVAASLNLEMVLKRKPNTLSGGQRQRVAIGRAIIREPKIFLFDEPLSNLDAALKETTRKELTSLHKKVGAIFLYVTHDQLEAMSMGDRIIVMNEGEIQQIDTPINIYENPKNLFVAKFIGTPKINTIDRKIYNYITGKNLELENVDICIRPEYLSVEKTDVKQTASGIVKSIEILGKDVCISVDYQNHGIIIVCLSQKNFDFNLKVGDCVVCSAAYDKILFFDKNSGNRV